jgi:hypothetical protein
MVIRIKVLMKNYEIQYVSEILVKLLEQSYTKNFKSILNCKENERA